MSPAGAQPSHCLHPSTFQFELLKDKNGKYHVRAELFGDSGASSATGLRPWSTGDLTFNISAVLGNDGGEFAWGRSFFDETAKGEPNLKSKGATVSQGRPGQKGCILEAELLDHNGHPKKAEIDLHTNLMVIEYHVAGEAYHRLTERGSVRAEARTLVLCFDGTSNHFSDKNTNVVKLMELLKKDDPKKQMVYYQTGVGTYSPSGLKTTVGRKVASLGDQGVAWYLYQHVIDGYRFLMQTYRAGDKIALFGFSRGAFTARVLAGMLHCVGLLPAHNSEHVAFAYEVYRNVKKSWENPDKCRQELADKKNKKPFEWLDPSKVHYQDFKKTFSVPVVIDFLGVWDTVASVGALWMREFRWIEYNPSVRVFRQALALDERRGNFIPSVWDHTNTEHEFQDVREVWFRGEHCDIGGGSAAPEGETPDAEKSTIAHLCSMVTQALQCDTSALPGPASSTASLKKGGSTINYTMLSNISLRWMVRQTLQFNTLILLDPKAVRDYQEKKILETPLVNGMSPNPGNKEPLTPQSSEDLDKQDSEKRICESLGWSPLWNTLEYLALTQKPFKVLSPAHQPLKSPKDQPHSDSQQKRTEDKYILQMTRRPNAKAGRSIYRSNPNHPIFIHSSAAIMARRTPEVKELGESLLPILKWLHKWFSSSSVKPPYRPRARWHLNVDHPFRAFCDEPTKLLIEDVTPNSDDLTLDPFETMRLNPGSDIPGSDQKSRGLFWTRVAGGCTLAATVWLVLLSAVPKSEIMTFSLYIESFWSWF